MVKISKFLGDISVRDLKLRFNCEKIWVQPEDVTKRLAYVFRRLTFVNLVDIPEGYGIIFVNGYRSRRAEGTLVYRGEGRDWESSASNFQHHNLATLIMFGFRFEDYMVSYVRRVMKAVVRLQDAFLYHRLACRKCHGKPPRPFFFPFTEMQQSIVEERITEGIDSSAQIHFPTGAVIRADHRAKFKYP